MPRPAGRGVVGVEAPALLAARLPRVLAARLEAERLLEQAVGCARGRSRTRGRRRSPGARAPRGSPDASRRAARPRSRRPRARGRTPSGSSKRSRPSRRASDVRLAGQPLLPEVERGLATPTRQVIVCTIPAPARPAARAGVLEEGDVGAGAALLVGVEEVVDGRIVLVDRLLDQPEAEHARVEVHVPGRVAGDQRDVVDAFEPHRRIVQP